MVWLHELYDKNKDEFYELHYANTNEMVADLFTKAFTDVNKFDTLKAMAGIASSWSEVYEEIRPILNSRGAKSAAAKN